MQNTPAAGTARASQNVCLLADVLEIAPPASEIQKFHLRNRFGLSTALAAVIASHAFAVSDRWGRA